ncbi:MAG: hypothetical protein HY033_10855 [Ignavibacteriae bacterium]|nr:hypothetical protein [Ignavibacteria bacterium]MBI3365398.1 hypothetical protein [Ignavibacteriota bacterium]
MTASAVQDNIRDALRAIVEGKIVKRIKHDLVHEGQDLTHLFVKELERHGYKPMTVDGVRCERGERVPAFYMKDSVAYFGWVFWEQFTSWKIRKLWGSVIKDKRGDWDIQIPATRKTTIYANESLTLEMDIDHPPEF